MAGDRKTRRLVVCSVQPGGRVSVNCVSDAARAFRRFRQLWVEPFLPVAAIRIEPHIFRRVTDWRLPSIHDIGVGAFVFGRVGIDEAAGKAFQRQLSLLGFEAGPLLGDWLRAVDGVSTVFDRDVCWGESEDASVSSRF